MAYRETARVRQRKAAVRDNLLSSAEAIVREEGFGGLTIQSLALRAGVGVGTVYRYFSAKETLADEIFRRVTEREVAAVGAAMEGQPSPVIALRQGLRVFAERALRAPRLAWALIAEPVSASLDSARLEYRAAWAQLFERPIARGVTDSLLPHQTPSLSAAALVGAIAEALVGPLADNAPSDELIETICDFCMRAVGAEVNHEPQS